MQLVGNDGVLDEQFKGDNLERRLMGGFEDDGAGGASLLHLEPARGTDAPAVAGLEAGEAMLRHGGGEVVAEGLRRGQEGLVDHAADGVDAEVVGAGLAAAGAVEAGHGSAAAGGEGLAEDVLAAGLGFGGQGSRSLYGSGWRRFRDFAVPAGWSDLFDFCCVICQSRCGGEGLAVFTAAIGRIYSPGVQGIGYIRLFLASQSIGTATPRWIRIGTMSASRRTCLQQIGLLESGA